MAVALGLALLATAGPAAAVDNGSLGIRPANESDFFHLSLYPGAATDATAIVSNHTQAPVTLLTYPVDGQSSPQGAFALAAQSDPRTGMGAWAQLGTDHITVPANSDLKVPFRISVPLGTPPGDYAGGLIIQSAPVQGKTSTVSGGAAVRLDVIQRQGVRIYLSVAGTAVKALQHGNLSWQHTGDTVTFTLPLHNTGNTILHPTAVVGLSGQIGANTQLTFDTPESVLPGATLNLHAHLSHAALIQVGSAQATITSEAGTDHARTSIFYAPWVLIGSALLILVLALYGAWRTVRFVRRARRAIAQLDASRSGPSPSHGRESRVEEASTILPMDVPAQATGHHALDDLPVGQGGEGRGGLLGDVPAQQPEVPIRPAPPRDAQTGERVAVPEVGSGPVVRGAVGDGEPVTPPEDRPTLPAVYPYVPANDVTD